MFPFDFGAVMTIFDFLSLIGGISLFIFGMQTMSNALEKRAGEKLKPLLSKMTSHPLKGFLLGVGVTAVMQSSTATTVMAVSFVGSGIMSLQQTIPVIMGANLGTTVTAWILSLSGIKSDSFIAMLFKPDTFVPVIALIGTILLLFSKKSEKKDVAQILLGFSVLMTGMSAMSQAVSGLKDVPQFAKALTLFKNPILGVMLGALITAIIQSSSASIGILQALCSTGTVTLGATIPIVMGQNIGTTVTAMLSSLGANKSAKSAAFVHLYFNVIGTLVLLVAFYVGDIFIGFSFKNAAANSADVALIHTVFNLLCTLIWLPFTRLLEKLALKTVK